MPTVAIDGQFRFVVILGKMTLSLLTSTYGWVTKMYAG